jgi:neutral trehalase
MSGDHHLQERRASARRDSVNRTLWGCNRAMFGDDRSDNQERRVSARRG